ncbi:FAD binding domain-containing protein [Halorubrum aquaticum]|uniref:FAD binding domain-containing protein n=2 Tax=Halorubrum aquaticum TaxID=387340 RepID=A0A1I3BXU5_9EURY|nr:FAD-dependent oxidoreductase [Halorubrum aquaticum]SFH67178.1 FAD binding domain-containing protein [Halorubrum aquaticum]
MEYDVVVVGGGVAGSSAATFTARHGLETLVCDAGRSLLRRNAHLENVPGFPAGVNSRHFLDLLGEQAENAGVERLDARVTVVDPASEERSESDEPNRFRVETADGDRIAADYVVAATKNATGYLEGIDGVDLLDRGKTFVDTDERGRTGVDGLYAAGRLARKPHQVAVCAGHGAEVAVTLLEDDDRPFYHDWVAPEGYFSDRGRPVPPGCEEIGETERRRRETRSLETTRERFAESHPDDQETHPSLRED